MSGLAFNAESYPLFSTVQAVVFKSYPMPMPANIC